MLTRNFHQLQAEVAAHVIADRVSQGSYQTCFIGCLSMQEDDPEYIEWVYGIPLMISRIAESVFEGLSESEAPEFFAALPSAIETDGKDLTRVGFQFLAAELRALPPVPTDVQAAIDPVITGLDILAEGKEWPSEADDRAARTVATSSKVRWAALAAAGAARNAITFAAAACSAPRAALAPYAAATTAARAADEAARAAEAAEAHQAVVARRRQRDTLLQLIKEAPVITTQEDS